MQRVLNQSLLIFFIAILIALLYLLAPILTPFLFGALLAYLADPLVIKLRCWRIPHMFSVILVFFLVFLILISLMVILIPLLEKQILMLVTTIPSMVVWAQKNIVPWLNAHFGIQELVSVETLKSTLAITASQVSNMFSWTLKTVLYSGYTVILWLANIILIPVVTFYLLRDWDRVLKGVHNLFPRSIESMLVKIIRDCDEVLSAFFRGQLLVMLGLGLIYSIGLSLIGLQLGLIIGLIAGLLSIVPYLGVIIGLLAASVAALVQFGTWSSLLLVALVFIAAQLVDTFTLTPVLIGNRIGLHPVAVIFAALAGGTLFGFFGVLLALPVAAVIMVWIRFFYQHYRGSEFYK